MSTTTQPQHIAALNQANRVRLARAALKRRIASGETPLAELLDRRQEIPWEADSMPLFELLCAQHRWGRARALKLLRPLAMAEHRRVGTLTVREREALVLALQGEHVPDRRLLAAQLHSAAGLCILRVAT